MIRIVGNALYQWDTGRAVSVTDVDADHVHFSNKGDSKAVVLGLDNSQSKIPDYLLQTGKQLCVYAVKNGVTVETIVFPVISRERPEDYIYEEDQRNFIYELIESAEAATEAANQAAEEILRAKENGEFNGPVGPQGPAGESPFVLHYNEMDCWGADGELIEEDPKKYTEALAAFHAGKVVIFFFTRLAMQGYETYYCVKNEAEGYFLPKALLFIGAMGNSVTSVRLFPNGRVSFGEIADISGLEVKQNVLESRLDSMPFKELTGTASNPVVLRDLVSGVYLVNGKIKNIRTASTTNAVNDFYLVSNNGTKTYAIKIATSLHAVHQYILTDTAATFNQCRLDLVLERLASAENTLDSFYSRLYKAEQKLPLHGHIIHTTLPSNALWGDIVLVDPSGKGNATTTEAWICLAGDSTKNEYIWKKLVFAD